ncbi:MAG: 4-(cytidine 5'-diphospho)-2-C-methyl-D-erythritol kinase [Bacteroidota bacterium]
MILQTRAYAKINLGLYVLRRRDDGYHDIGTVFHRINLFDTLTFEESEEITLRTDSPSIPQGEDNLCTRAAILLRQRLGIARGVSIGLDKVIPVGAGLGGGSSDAAATLTMLPRFWGIPVTEDLLREVALKLGSDIPYFLKEGSAVGAGRGEVLEYFSLPLPFAILVCNPGIHVSTAWAYSQIRPDPDRRLPDFKRVFQDDLGAAGKIHHLLVNDFEEPVFRKYPLIGKIKQEMLNAGASAALMSGSGSTVFGLFRDQNNAYSLGDELSRRGYTVSVTEPGFAPQPVQPFISIPRTH